MNIDSFTKKTLAVVLAGGSGTRLQALTRWQAKPAVPFGGKYRTIDFTLSNCVNSDIRKISVLTQYKSHTLNKHIHAGWNIFSPELNEFIDLIPAQQRLQSSWYQGTADAVYQNLDIFREAGPRYVLILAGDHVYKMDYRPMIEHHIRQAAEMTIGCVEVPVVDARHFGIVSIDGQYRITAFSEKPSTAPALLEQAGMTLASMGIYVFNAEFLYRQLELDAERVHSSHDFGHDIIPQLLGRHRLYAFPFRDRQTGLPGYWRDVGTIDAYFEANMDLCSIAPKMNLYDTRWPVWTYQQQLPPAKFIVKDSKHPGAVVDSIISGGCVVVDAAIVQTVLANNVRVGAGSTIERSVVLNDSVIGRDCRIRNAIIDCTCDIPDGSTIGFDAQVDARRFQISANGVVVVAPEMLREQRSLTCLAL